MTVYQKIDKALSQHEQNGYYERSLSSIADYIDWAYKFRKISEEEKNEVCIRIISLFEKELTL